MAVEEFVRGGGTLIASGNSSGWAIDLFRVPLIDVTREAAHREFSCPGSVLRGIPVTGHAYTAGLPDSLALFFSRSAAWRELTQAESKQAQLEPLPMQTLLRYAPTRMLLSGWVNQAEAITGKSAWVEVQYGQGRLHLFAFRPLYRAWSQATFPLLFRAILLPPPVQD